MATGTSSAYPPPPPYYRLYKDYLEDPESAPEPPPPVQGTYPLFGATYTLHHDNFLRFLFFLFGDCGILDRCGAADLGGSGSTSALPQRPQHWYYFCLFSFSCCYWLFS
ncbi:hypothetical protein GW17_00057196 [Ensete ventricosum]|nr:hypothetical protein GW17_00057196 [Ensete ventricosum]RZS05110.1 hypothetical protein BHM03_00035563 [Ensete ventricosum]